MRKSVCQQKNILVGLFLRGCVILALVFGSWPDAELELRTPPDALLIDIGVFLLFGWVSFDRSGRILRPDLLCKIFLLPLASATCYYCLVVFPHVWKRFHDAVAGFAAIYIWKVQ